MGFFISVVVSTHNFVNGFRSQYGHLAKNVINQLGGYHILALLISCYHLWPHISNIKAIVCCCILLHFVHLFFMKVNHLEYVNLGFPQP